MAAPGFAGSKGCMLKKGTLKHTDEINMFKEMIGLQNEIIKLPQKPRVI